MADKMVHVFISGDVQGVGYRTWALNVADELGLDGWIRNISDGTVEAVFSGDEDAVDEMLDQCKSGPDSCQVDHVEIEDAEDDYIEEGFYTRASA